MAGDDTKGHPAGTKTGDAIHQFQSGSIQMITDVAVDPAGNVWAANNWNALEAVVADSPFRPTSTWGGGSGFTYFEDIRHAPANLYVPAHTEPFCFP